ncbi:MAG: lipoprotein signal peptidase, partial [Sulfuricurvum sp.]|nr:lipoprotein signal peptidase [Sulfuricurvum sp.]
MVKSLSILVLAAMGIFIVDQNIKWLFVDGYRCYTECIDLILVYNRGVAFSMFAFLEEGLKWIQLVLL